MSALRIIPSNGFFLSITNQDGSLARAWPSDAMETFSCNIERYGGYADFTVLFAESIVSSLLYNVEHCDKIEAWFDGVLQYRGYVSGITPSESEPNKISIVGYGRSQTLKKSAIDLNLVYPSGSVDLSTVFYAVINDYVIPQLLATNALTLRVSANFINVPMRTFTAKNTTLGNGLDFLTQAANNLSVWAVYVDSSGFDIALISPLGSATNADHVIVVPGRKSGDFSSESQSADIINSAILIGGDPLFSNLIHNGDFESPILAADTIVTTNNIIDNGSWERGGTPWTFSSGASIEKGKAGQYNSAGADHVQAFDGNNYLEMDHVGEKGSLTLTAPFLFTLNADEQYTFDYRSWQENDVQVIHGSVSFKMYDVSNTLLLDYEFDDVPSPNIWSYRPYTFSMPTGVHKITVDFELTSITTPPSGIGGWCIDFVRLYQSNVAYQDGWYFHSSNEFFNTGISSFVTRYDWLYGETHSGSYSVLFEQTSTGGTGTVALTTSDSLKSKVTQGSTYVFGCYIKSPASSLQSSPTGIHPYVPTTFYMTINWAGSDGSYAGQSFQMYTYPSNTLLSDWTLVKVIAGAPSGATQAQVFVNMASSGTLVVDDIFLRNGGYTTETGYTDFIPEGSLVMRVNTSDTALNSLFPVNPYSTSIDTYGERCAVITQGIITNITDGYTFLDTYFRSSALPFKRISGSLFDDKREILPGQTIRIAGKDGNRLSGGDILPIVRVSLKYDGILTKNIEISRELPDTAVILQQIQDQATRKFGPSSSSGSAGSGSVIGSTGGSGGGSAVASYRTTLQASSTDTTLHDDYRAGPHIEDTERTDWTDTTTEVVAARAAFSTVDDRLSDIESAVLATTAGRGSSLPTASVTYHEKFYVVEVGGLDDTIHFCIQKADTSYAWVQVVTI